MTQMNSRTLPDALSPDARFEAFALSLWEGRKVYLGTWQGGLFGVEDANGQLVPVWSNVESFNRCINGQFSGLSIELKPVDPDEWLEKALPSFASRGFRILIDPDQSGHSAVITASDLVDRTKAAFEILSKSLTLKVKLKKLEG